MSEIQHGKKGFRRSETQDYWKVYSDDEEGIEEAWNREITEILKVNGGMLYHRVIFNNETISTSMCFVPDVDLQRYQAHLRDAYKQGYITGQLDAKNNISES